MAADSWRVAKVESQLRVYKADNKWADSLLIGNKSDIASLAPRLEDSYSQYAIRALERRS